LAELNSAKDVMTQVLKWGETVQMKVVILLWLELNSAKDVMTQVLKWGETVQMKVVILLWLWWSERNAVREGDRRRTAGELAYVVHKNAVEFLEVHNKPIGGQMRSVQCWSKPPEDWLKINSDGAFLVNEENGGWGYVF
jgi:hypothetical protein